MATFLPLFSGLADNYLSTIDITWSNDVRVLISCTRFPALCVSYTCLLGVLIGSLDCVCRYVIGQIDYFSFGFTTLNSKTPLLRSYVKDYFPVFSKLFIQENATPSLLYIDYIIFICNICFVISVVCLETRYNLNLL